MNLAPVQLSSETRALAVVNRWAEKLTRSRRESLRPVAAALVAEIRAAIDGEDLIVIREPEIRAEVAA